MLKDAITRVLSKAVLYVFCLVPCVFLNSCSEISKKTEVAKIVFLLRATPEQFSIWETVVDVFKRKNPGIEVELQNVEDRYYWSKLRTMIAGGTAPDVIFMESYRIKAYILHDSLEDLSPYIRRSKNIKASDFYEESLNLYRFGDKVYGLPNDIAVYCMFYNKDIFDNYGVAYPVDDWTWEDFMEKAKKLTLDIDSDGIKDVYGYVYGHPFSSFLWIWQNNAYLTDDYLNPGRITVTSDNFVQALKFISDMRFKYNIVPGVTEMEVLNTSLFFVQGRVAMVVDGHWMVPYYKNYANFKWDVVMLPKGKQKATLGEGSCFSISKGSKNKRAAWRLIEFLAGEHGQKLIVKMGFSTPALKKIAESEQYFSSKSYSEDAFIKSIPFGKCFPRTEHLAELQDAFYRLHEIVVMDKNADIGSLCEKYGKEMQEILGQ